MSTAPWRDRRFQAHPWSVAAGLAFVAFTTWLLAFRPTLHTRQVAADLVPLGFEVLVIVLAALGARRRRAGRERWAWTLVALAFLLYLLGDGTWALFELVQHRSPFPSVADAFYLAFYPVLLAGLLSLPGPRRRRNDWRRPGLDVLTVTIAGAMTVWYLVIGPTLEQGLGMSFASVLSLAYPVGDLVLVFGIATVIVRGSTSSGGFAARAMAVGATAFVVADLGFATLDLAGRYEVGMWPDVGWILALVCFVVAADVERHRPTIADRRARSVGQSPVSPLPYVAIACSFALLIHVGFSTAGASVRTLLFLVLALTATVVARQVTAVRDGARMTNQLQELATTDPLTSLANRRRLLDAAEDEFTEALLHGDDLAVMFIDVDHFESINDLHGHAVGDAVLVWLSGQLHSIVRPEDLVGRFGGDEFVALVPGLDGHQVLAIARRLEQAVADAGPPLVHGPARISLSIGVATADGCRNLDELLARADAALYRAKRSGRGRACLSNHGETLVRQ